MARFYCNPCARIAASSAFCPTSNPPSPREEFLAGSREVAPSLVGTIPFGLVVGVASVAVLAGAVAGSGAPSGWSLDFVVVLTFIALLVPVVRRRADLAAAVVAGTLAIAASGLPYRLSLIAGSIAGIAVGMALDISRRSLPR